MRVLVGHAFEHGTRHARNLMPAVDEVVERAGLRKAEIDAVAVSEGPGSFTGLRVGIACAKTLAWALDWRAVGVPTLEVKVQNVRADDYPDVRRACPVQDARRGHVYGDLFERRDGRWHDATGVLLKPPRELAEMLPEGALVFGDGVAAYEDVFRGRGLRIGPAELGVARPEAVARLGLRRLERGGAVDPVQLVPRYHRLTAPEEKALGEGGG